MKATVLLVGRILFGGFFLFNGVNHLTHVAAMAGYAGSRGVPSPDLAVVATGLLLVVGGASVLLGIAPRVGLLFLLVFLVPVTLTMHRFWAVPEAQRLPETIQFLKNTALTGAALALMAVPVPWPLALDARIGRRWPGWTRRTAFEHRV